MKQKSYKQRARTNTPIFIIKHFALMYTSNKDIEIDIVSAIIQVKVFANIQKQKKNAQLI